MSKGPTPRHSKSPKPLTIDLDAKDVTPQSASSAETKPATDKAKPAGKPAEAAPSTSSGSTPKVSAAGATTPATKTETATDKKPAGPGAKPATSDAGTSSTAKSGPSASVAQGNASNSTPDQAQAQGEPQAKAQAQAETKRSEPKPAQTAPANRGGGLGLVASGLIGAIIALGGGYGLQTSGLLPVPVVSSDSADQVQSLASRVDGLAGTVDQLSADLSALPSDDGSSLTTELQARLASLEAAIAGGAAAPGDGATVDLGLLTARLDALEASIAALAESAGDTSADPELASAVTELKAGQSGVNAAVSELQSQSAALRESVAGLEQRQATLEAQLDEPSRQIDLARAIAAAGLKTAIERGGPFMSELEAFASVAPDDPAVSELRDLAARGVPSRSDLMEAFPDAANRAIAAANPIDPDAGLVDRLMSSALSVVKVRPVGEVEGDTADAIVARTEARLLDGNLDAALSEWNTLPQAALAATSDFGDSLAARARAEKLIASSLTGGALPAAPASSQAPAN